MMSSAQTFKTLQNFNGTDGSHPVASLVQTINGGLYGTTINGGPLGNGSIFAVTTGGLLKNLYSFCSQQGCPDGYGPVAPLIEGSDGNLYGTTGQGGVNQKGTVFKISLAGVLTTLYSFCSQAGCSDGSNPSSGLVEGFDESFYGTTTYGGAYDRGTVFKITPSGALTVLYSFDTSEAVDPSGTLIQAADGSFYGTTEEGGANYQGGNVIGGTVFKITPGGTLTTTYSFCSESGCADGQGPEGGVLQARDGNFYGTTYYGGPPCSQSTWGCGTVFKLTPSGTLTTLFSFDWTDGSYPFALIQATDGNFYGTTYQGGTEGDGTIFEITASGVLTTLHNFCDAQCQDGFYPAPLIQDTNGTFYGTTYGSGNRSLDGTIFGLSMGFGAFIETQTSFGHVGARVKILGTNLTGSTGVTFNGTAATFTVASPSLITAIVPAGATTGTVQVITLAGTLSSNAPFRVIP